MRTTLTLDEDVAAKLKARVRRSGGSLKQVVNEMLRLGLGREKILRSGRPFRIRVRDTGLRPGISLENVWKLMGELDGPMFR